MDYFLPSSVRSRLLRFALAKTGFLDTDTLDLDKLNFTIGRNSSAEFKDVGIRLEKLTALLQLPPTLQILAARAVTVRVNVASDLTITTEVDGVQLRARVERVEVETERDLESSKTPRHRKTAKRIDSPPSHDPGGRQFRPVEDASLPTAQDLATSFLDVEPAKEKRELEAAILSQSKSIEASITSDDSDEAIVGTGNALGLPGFLARMLQSILDRLTVTIRDINIRCDANVPSVTGPTRLVPVGIALNIAHIHIDPVASIEVNANSQSPINEAYVGRRRISLGALNVDLLCEPASSGDTYGSATSPSTPAESPSALRSPSKEGAHASPSQVPLQVSVPQSNKDEPADYDESAPTTPTFEQSSRDHYSPAVSPVSVTTSTKGRFADAAEDDSIDSTNDTDVYDIRAGEDSHSYTSRRSQTSSDPDNTAFAPLEDSQLLSASIEDFQSSDGESTRYDFHSIRPTAEAPSFGITQDSSPRVVDFGARITYQPQAYSDHDSPTFPNSPDDDDVNDPMTQSVMYSQEMGKSMYLSAISQSTPSPPEYRRAPGYFPDESYLEYPAQSTSTLKSAEAPDSNDLEDRAPTPRARESRETLPDAGSEFHTTGRLNASRSGMDDNSQNQESPSEVFKRLLVLDSMTVWLPSTQQAANQDQPTIQAGTFEVSPQDSVTASLYARDMPGTFSAYAEMGGSRRLQASYVQDQPSISDLSSSTTIDKANIDINLSLLNIQADIAAVKLLSQVHTLVESSAKESHDETDNVVEQANQTSLPQVSLRLGTLQLSLVEQVTEVPVSPSGKTQADDMGEPKVVMRAKAKDLTFGLHSQANTPNVIFAIRKLTIGTASKDLLSFKQPKSARVNRSGSPEILVKFQRSQPTSQGNSVTNIRTWIRPLNLDLDLVAIDDALSVFGGVSGIMELSASVASSDPGPASIPRSPVRRGVRFEEDLETPAIASGTTELKLNTSIQGATIVLRSGSCSLQVQCSSTKINVRPKYVLVTLGNASLCEIFDDEVLSRFMVHIKDLRLDYLPAPEDTDLERLLSLITPSKNKYENDDDILMDTLIRQRRKGAVLRIKVASAAMEIESWAFVSDLQLLGDELSRFSAVAKYLPEDDRPGLLILPRIVDLNVRVPVNKSFGTLEISCRDLQSAYVGLPALIAFSVGSIRAGPLDGRDLVHEVRPNDQLPMIMMRMIGDEVEPTIKVKFYNLALEYDVSTIVALTSVDHPLEPVDAALQASVSILSTMVAEGQASPPSPIIERGSATKAGKKVRLDVLLLDSALGMNPLDSEARGVLVLSNTRLDTIIPADQTFTATLELRKASLHIIDQKQSSPTPAEIVARPPGSVDRLQAYLTAQGYISVSSIMSAKATVTITENQITKQRSADVEVRDELFLLETCADSTQTLISILNGLSPPAPPNMEPKFRTEVMTVPDMIASFTGDAFGESSRTADTLFDADTTSPISEVDDLLQQSSLTNSLYGPTDAFVHSDEEHAIFDNEQDRAQTIESFIEEEGFYEVMEASRTQHLDNDSLLEHIQRQSKQSSGRPEVMLKSFFFGDEYLDKAHSTVQYPARVTGTTLGGDGGFASQIIEPFPLQLRVRDVHVIWNLYDGYDWKRTRDAIAEAVEDVEQQLEERKQNRRRSTEAEDEDESVIGDCLFNSIYIGVPANRDAADLRHEISRGIDDLVSESESYATSGTSRPTTPYSSARHGRPRPRKRKLHLARSKAHKIAFELKGASLDFSLYPQGSGEVQSSVDVRLSDFEIFDNVPTSTWRKFLTYSQDDENMREMMKPMIHIEVLNLRPVADLAATELSLRVSVLPLRLHVDQDALDFITRFFEFKPDTAAPSSPSSSPFIQRIEVNTVGLCLDYKPKKVDYAGIRSGHTGEFKNFVILDRANIKLKHVIVYGIHGFDALHPTLSDIWTPDVIRNQLPGVLAGLGPLRSLVSLGAGVRDVVAIPVREYKKDGRLVRSVQKGAFQFVKTTTAELARLGAKLAVGTQNVLSGVEETLGHTRDEGDDGSEQEDRRLVSNYADQPLGVLQGLQSGRRQLERDLLTARDAFIAVQGELVDSSSAAGAARTFARHAPTIILRPVIGASRAVGQTLMGVGNQVDRANVRRTEDKYKPR